MTQKKTEFPEDFSFHQDKILEAIKLKEFIKNRTVYITGEINDDTALRVRYMLERIADKDVRDKISPDKREPIILKIDSPGGCVYSTMSIISTIESLKEQGFEIRTIALGMAMSGAFKVLISGSKRFCQRNTHLMCHQPSSFEFGYSTYMDKERNVEIIKAIWGRLKDIIVHYTSISYTELDDITEKNKDWFFWPEEAIKYKIIDEII